MSGKMSLEKSQSLQSHILCRAAASREFQETLIAEDPKDRKKARLSWYHPDDTMVPRGWFKGGLLEDIKYYAPFMSSKST